jgi:hypothetical protein
MKRQGLERWIDSYLGAWASNDPEEIAALFTEEAVYFTAPFRDPWRGREAIVGGWIQRADRDGNWLFEHDIQAIGDGLGFVRGRTTYHEPPTVYSNLWVIRLEGDGRSSEFTEWWMVQD